MFLLFMCIDAMFGPLLFKTFLLGAGRTMAQLIWTVLLVLLMPLQAGAQGIESILAPGQVIHGHAKLENDCKQCHVRFDRKAQSGLCADCHKDVGADVKAKTGYHGTLKPQACNVCHTDHKGREAKIAYFDTKTFDHTRTDFMLKGKHNLLACDKCHAIDKEYRDAPLQCNGCHRKDDKHKGALGVKCGDCHNENSWKEAKFDHSTTRFAIQGKHLDAKCADCHKGGVFKETPRLCASCHDSNKGHKGLFGEKCETCHGVNGWKPATFNHDTDTKYDLRGKHRTVPCAACHIGNPYRVKSSQDCYACHGKDDKHKDSLGRDCIRCHSERSWKDTAKFDHSSFPLLGKHVNIECKACHT